MKILQIHNSYLQGGGEDVLVDAQVAALRAEGHDVTVASVKNPPDTVNQVRTFTFAPWNPAAARALGRVADTVAPEIAHLHNTWYSWSPSVISALGRRSIPVVMTVHNFRLICANATFYRDGAPCTDCLGTHPWRSVVHRCYHESAPQSAVAAGTLTLNRMLGTWHRGIDRYVVSTQFLRGVLEVAGFPPDRIRVVRPTVPDIGGRARPPSLSRQVVYAGRLEPGKGVEPLLDAWRRVDVGPELLIVGDGPLRPLLESQAIPRVRFLGWLPHEQLRSLMGHARALVFPSTSYETLGLSLVEGLSAGLPALAVDIGTRREVVGEDGAGWLVAPDDSAGWETTLSVLADDEAVDAASAAARQRYEEHFAPAVTVPALVRLYRELAA